MSCRAHATACGFTEYEAITAFSPMATRQPIGAEMTILNADNPAHAAVGRLQAEPIIWLTTMTRWASHSRPR
jgi:hypothetical protein